MKTHGIPTILAFTAAVLPATGGDHATNHATKKEPLPAITLRVLNQAQIDERVLEKAKEEATAMLGRAGVGLVWVDCGASIADSKDKEPCQGARGRAEFWMRLTNDRPAWASKENLGFTQLAGEDGSAGVYYPAVLNSAQRFVHYGNGIAPVIVFTPYFLGAAIVHEIGHLILGAHSHTPSGVMCAEWGREQLESISTGKLSFARDQVKPLQIEVRRRLSEGQPSQRR
jgi:hypothetical protein